MGLCAYSCHWWHYWRTDCCCRLQHAVRLVQISWVRLLTQLLKESPQILLTSQKEKLIQAIKDGVPGSEIKWPILKIVKHREQLESFLEGKGDAPVLLHPNMSLRYQEEVNALRESLNRKETRSEAAELLRGLIDKIVLTPKACGKEYAIDLHGDLAGILTVSVGKQKRIGESDPLLRQVKMMTESGDQKNGWQDNSCIDDPSSEGILPDKNNAVSENDEKSRESRLLVTLITL